MSFLVGVWWRARRVGVDAHNTMGCIMSVWCGIVFVWGEVFAPGLNYLLEEEICYGYLRLWCPVYCCWFECGVC